MALHKDVALGLTKFGQKLCKHLSRVELRGKRGGKVAVLLSRDIVDSLTLLINKRKDCGTSQRNNGKGVPHNTATYGFGDL